METAAAPDLTAGNAGAHYGEYKAGEWLGGATVFFYIIQVKVLTPA